MYDTSALVLMALVFVWNMAFLMAEQNEHSLPLVGKKDDHERWFFAEL